MALFPFTPYSSVKPILDSGVTGPLWYPEHERDRVAAYVKYDELYWNDDTQFVLRVLMGEQPIYIPNARTIVDTTSYYLLKGLQITCDAEKNPDLSSALTAFLDRELFYPRFHTAKHAGVARGDFVLHMTANPAKADGSRISLNSVDPANVIPIYDDDDCDKLLRVHLIDIWVDPRDREQYVKKLTYEYEYDDKDVVRKISRSEGIYTLRNNWWGQNPELVKTTIPKSYLPPSITTIPVYWFKNVDWEGQLYGSSELRGFERLLQGISQAATDQEAALSLEGLGVYATDGGRPVNDNGVEVDWEISPGKVMEVPTGSYFRRVEGVGSMKPSMDHINYIESKLREAGGLSDVALGRVDVQTAQSGIALAIKFIPTLAKIEERDTAGLAKLKQMFYDWKTWYSVYEKTTLTGDIVPVIGEKLPQDVTAAINILNNMMDREVISVQYYRQKMQEFGWVFPDDIQQEIDDANQKKAEQAAAAAPENLAQNAQDAVTGKRPPPPGPNGSQANKQPNNSNNKGKPNESAGTEAGQTLRRQARGGTPSGRNA